MGEVEVGKFAEEDQEALELGEGEGEEEEN